MFVRRAISTRASTAHIRRIATSAQHPQKLDTTGRASGFARRLRPSTPPPRPPEDEQNGAPSSSQDAVSNALQSAAQDHTNNLLSPVHIPEDPHGILKSNHPATNILANSSIVVQRQLEMMNVMLGFEQANKYVIMDGQGNHIGYLAEQEHGIASAVARQTFRTHRSFTTHVFDRDQKEVLRFHRPFSWISSSIRVYDAVNAAAGSSTSSALDGTAVATITGQTSAQISPLNISDMRIIGEAQQQWAPLRRKYNLFLHRDLDASATADAPQLTSGDIPLSNSTALTIPEAGGQTLGFSQFAAVNEPFLSWDFRLQSADGRQLGSVNRNFSGFAREIFTDTGVYALRMDSAALESLANPAVSDPVGMTLDQRAVMLATAVSIDFDYFSRHSGSMGGVGGGGFFPIWFPMGGGGGGAAAETGAGAAGEAGAVTSEAGNAAKGVVGAGEGAIAGAGTMAGYEAMQRGREAMQGDTQQQQEDLGWGSPAPGESQGSAPWQANKEDPWRSPWDDNQGGNTGGGGNDGGGDGGGGGDFDWF